MNRYAHMTIAAYKKTSAVRGSHRPDAMRDKAPAGNYPFLRPSPKNHLYAHPPPTHHLPLPCLRLVKNHSTPQRCTDARRHANRMPPMPAHPPRPPARQHRTGNAGRPGAAAATLGPLMAWQGNVHRYKFSSYQRSTHKRYSCISCK